MEGVPDEDSAISLVAARAMASCLKRSKSRLEVFRCHNHERLFSCHFTLDRQKRPNQQDICWCTWLMSLPRVAAHCSGRQTLGRPWRSRKVRGLLYLSRIDQQLSQASCALVVHDLREPSLNLQDLSRSDHCVCSSRLGRIITTHQLAAD